MGGQRDALRANRRSTNTECVFGTLKIAAVLLNVLIILLLIAIIIIEISVHQSDDFLKDIEDYNEVEQAFAKSGCVGLILTSVVVLVAPCIGFCGLLAQSLYGTAAYSFAMIIASLIAVSVLPYGYGLGALLALGAASGIMFAKALRDRLLENSLGSDGLPLA